jgi:hypothetical protein
MSAEFDTRSVPFQPDHPLIQPAAFQWLLNCNKTIIQHKRRMERLIYHRQTGGKSVRRLQRARSHYRNPVAPKVIVEACQAFYTHILTTCTGVIPQLRPHFVSLNKKGKTSTAYLCSPDTDHVATGLTDLGWGCGYRNCQMLMTFLSRQREQNEPVIEGVANISGLQMLLEKAWKEGSDMSKPGGIVRSCTNSIHRVRSRGGGSA